MKDLRLIDFAKVSNVLRYIRPSATTSSCSVEIGLLMEHGCSLPQNMQGLTEEQIVELKLEDEFADKCIPSGGYVSSVDAIGRRNGRGESTKANSVFRADNI